MIFKKTNIKHGDYGKKVCIHLLTQTIQTSILCISLKKIDTSL